jgi:hypothetical protein
MGDDSIDTVILDIDMGYIVNLALCFGGGPVVPLLHHHILAVLQPQEAHR